MCFLVVLIFVFKNHLMVMYLAIVDLFYVGIVVAGVVCGIVAVAGVVFVATATTTTTATTNNYIGI